MPCSAVTLSLATITSILAVALLAIAFATDNWLYIDVRRNNIQTFLKTNSSAESRSALQNVNSQYYYYTRTKGLFRICYPKERPPSVVTYLSPLETHCQNIDYYLVDDGEVTKNYSDDSWSRLHMGRAAIALFICSFFLVFVAFITGVAGCWKRSPGQITITAILMLFACLTAAGGMGLWHGADYYEREKVIGPEHPQEWPQILQENSTISYDWSFVLGWLGVFMSCFSFFLFLFGSCCLSSEKQQEQLNNMQYIMPVYPQKQQYAYAGYPVPPQAYAGPYYTTGSTYGPYNY